MQPKVVIQMLSYKHPGSKRDIEEFFESVRNLDYPRERLYLVVVDNPSIHGSAYETIKKKWQNADGMPGMTIVKNVGNNGFAGGHVQALSYGLWYEPEFVYLINQDATLHRDVLKEAVEYAQNKPSAAIVQSRIMLKNRAAFLNSQGNCLHFLGFGYANGNGKTVKEGFKSDKPMFYASGAGVLVRTSALESIGGLFDPSYFMYHEDVDLSWRARLAGLEVGYAHESVVFHRYEFSRSISKFEAMERNRWTTHLSNLKWGTLLLIVPALLVMEVGSLLFALKGGWFKQKIRAIAHFIKPETWREVKAKRIAIRGIRKVKDRDILRYMVGKIDAQEVQSPLWRYIVNPVFGVYFRVLKGVVRW